MKHLIGLEIHPVTSSSLNYLSIGGYNNSIVNDPNQIKWIDTSRPKHWDIFVTSLGFQDQTIIENKYGLRARISVEQKGIIIKQKHWNLIYEILSEKNSMVKLDCF